MTSAELKEVIDSQNEEFLQSPLGKAFIELNEKGVRAYKDCGRDPKDGLEIITEHGEYKGPFVFFDEQEHWSFLEKNECFLNFGSLQKDFDLIELGSSIIRVLEKEGIKCFWEKNINDAILIEVPYRYKDFFSLRDLIIAAFRYQYYVSNTATECMIKEITCFLDQDDNVSMFASYDLEDEDDLEDLDTIFQTFMVTKEELIKHRSFTLSQDPESYSDHFSEELYPVSTYRTIEELVDNVEWDAVWGSIHYFCDKSVIGNRIAKICGVKIEEINLDDLKEKILG